MPEGDLCLWAPIYGIKAYVSRLRKKKKWWLDAGSNRGHTDFQSVALPTELSSHIATIAASGLLCPNQGLLQVLILLLTLVFSHYCPYANLHLPDQTEEKRPEAQTL